MKNVIVDCFVEEQSKTPLFIILNIGNEVKLKSGLLVI
jgi:hypothetical protein